MSGYHYFKSAHGVFFRISPETALENALPEASEWGFSKAWESLEDRRFDMPDNPLHEITSSDLPASLRLVGDTDARMNESSVTEGGA